MRGLLVGLGVLLVQIVVLAGCGNVKTTVLNGYYRQFLYRESTAANGKIQS
jgi:hypothetical protein